MKSIFYNFKPWILGSALLWSCSGHIEESVTYDVYRFPVKGFSGLDFLGITKAKGIDKKHQDYLVSLVKGCGQFQKVDYLNKTFTLSKGDQDTVRKALKKDVGSFQDARYVHGVLVVELLKNSSRETNKKGSLVVVRDQLDHSWFDSYGNAANPRNVIYGHEEIAPKVKHLGKKIPLKHNRVEIGVRYTLYNKAKDTIVMDQTSYIGATLTTYSKKPVINSKSLNGILANHLMARIARNVCPKVATVERNLYAAGNDSQADKLIEQGIELVDDGDWEKAADSWKKAILVDKKNQMALHNLGVYYEKSGNVPAAMEEFQKSKKGSPVAGVRLNQYDESLDLFRPRLNPLELEPHVYGISGAGWVSVFGGKSNLLKNGRVYSVYRTKRLTNPPKYRVDGMELVEVGKIKILKDDQNFKAGRIIQFIEPYRIEMGDVVLVK